MSRALSAALGLFFLLSHHAADIFQGLSTIMTVQPHKSPCYTCGVEPESLSPKRVPPSGL